MALEKGDEDYESFKKRTGKSRDEYRTVIPKALPIYLFTLTHIKNTAIYAGSDSYRESDIVNHHSHTSKTEGISYLTDANKEWVNQAARITRLVLHDLQNVVYMPSITEIMESVNDLELRTQIIEATNTSDILTNSLRGQSIEGANEISIIVLDTIDSAMYFIHYITQAEEIYSKLLVVRPDWVEKTLIPQVEWMTRTLTRMSAVAKAQKQYDKIAVHLPQLFEHLLETAE